MKRALVGLVAVLAGAGAFLATRSSGPAPKFDVATQDAALLAKAWAQVPAGYANPPLSQSNPSACGPTSVANVYRSIGVQATSDDVAKHGAGCVMGVCLGGLTLDQLAEAAQDPKWKVTVLRDLTVEQLRDELRHVGDPRRRYVVNFHRGPIFSSGGGHHSPIGAYLEPEDLVFVLDVNARYGPWLVPTAKLFEAMNTVDSSSGKKRGLLRFEVN